MPTDPLLRLPDVLKLTALSRSSVYDGIRKGCFPAPVRVSRRAVRWRSQDLASWLEKLNSTERRAPVSR